MPLRVSNPFERLTDAINEASPAFHLPITELSGTTIKDVSGNGRDGTLSGTVTLNDQTAPDGLPAALFGGGHIEIADNAAFSVGATYGMTVGCVAKFSSTPSTLRWLISKGAVGQYEWDLYATNTGGNGNFALTLNTAAGGTLCSKITTRSPIGTSWCLIIAVVQNRSASASNHINLWKDNVVPIQYATQSGASTPYADGTAAVRIGARADGASTPMNGYIRNAFMIPDALDRGGVQRIISACNRENWGF